MIKRFHKMESRYQLVFVILIAFAVVSFWRGIWGLMDEYFFPGHYQLSLWFSLILGLVILIVTGYASKELI